MSFYTQLDAGTFDSSPLTAGPWSAESQHAGPPSALLARAIERFEPREGHRLGRVGVDILGAVPIAPLNISVERLRAGRRIELLQARAAVDGRDVLVARAWRLHRTPEEFPTRPPVKPTVMPDLPEPQPMNLPWVHGDGYMSAIDFRYAQGSFADEGPAVAWGRQMVPLVDDEEPTAWQRALVLADSGSGISLALDPTTYPAINCDLSVVLHRDPVGEWICLDSTTSISAGEGAVTETTLLDGGGPIGTATQTLLAG